MDILHLDVFTQWGLLSILAAVLILLLGLVIFLILSSKKSRLHSNLTGLSGEPFTSGNPPEDKFRGLLEAAPDAMVLTDGRGRIQLINRQTELMFGYTRDELLGQDVEVLIPEAFRNRHMGHRAKYLEFPKVRSMGLGLELFALRKEGSQFPVEISLSPLKTSEGTLILASVRDITERKNSEEKFRGLLEAAPDAKVIVDESGKIVLVNRQTERMFGYSREELIGKFVEFLIPGDFKGIHEKHRMQYTQSPKVRSMGVGLELFAVKKDGTQFPVEISLSPLKTNDGMLISSSVRDITERKKSEEKFRGLLEAAPDAMVIVDENGRILLINRQTETMFGYSRDDLIGKTVEILIPDNFREVHENHRFQYMKMPKVRAMGVGIELFALKRDGTQFPVEISLSPLSTINGTLISASVRDITYRKKSEEKFRGLLEAAPDAMIITNEAGQIVLINRKTETLLNYTRQELTGKPVEVLLPEGFRSRHELLRKRYMESPEGKEMATEVELFAVRKDGFQVPVEVNLSPLTTEDGTLISASLRDITFRKRAEEALNRLNAELEGRVQQRTQEIYENERRFRNTLENMLEGIQIIGFDWKYIFVNDAMAKHGRYSKEELIGHTVMEKYPGIEHTEIFKVYQQCFEERVSIHLENEFVFPDNSKGWFELSFQPVPEGLSILSVDITDRKTAEENINQLNKELEERVIRRTSQLRKTNEELEAFTYSVSHDLRAPLRSIIGFANILEEEYAQKLDDEAKRITSVIKNSALRMGRLIDDLLEFSRMERQELTRISVNTQRMVETVIKELDMNPGRIQWVIHPLPDVKADRNTIRQVWINLISNAMKYSRKENPPKIEIGVKKDGGGDTFFVKDNGVGFEEKYKSKLFKVFQRLHTQEEFEGTGIGLAIVDKVVFRHGGMVRAESRLGNGATFYFSIPDESLKKTNQQPP